MESSYGFGRMVELTFEQAVEHVTAGLQAEGFGILTEIDVAATLKKKLDKDIPPYRILGACNPTLAHQALQTDPSIGLLLPCNVVVRQNDKREVFVEFMDPEAVLNLVDNQDIAKLAQEVRQKLGRVMEGL